MATVGGSWSVLPTASAKLTSPVKTSGSLADPLSSDPQLMENQQQHTAAIRMIFVCLVLIATSESGVDACREMGAGRGAVDYS